MIQRDTADDATPRSQASAEIAITSDGFLLEIPHRLGSGVQRIYRFADGHGLSAVNCQRLHSYPFAWEIAVINGVNEHGNFAELDYSTELTEDVEVCMSNAKANEFIAKAKALFGSAT